MLFESCSPEVEEEEEGLEKRKKGKIFSRIVARIVAGIVVEFPGFHFVSVFDPLEADIL